MDNRERIIRLWFDMWLAKKDLGIFNVFSDNAVYIESWGPEYHGSKKIKLWFEEWNTRGTVLQWDIKQFFHKGNQTIVEWYFKNKMDAGNVELFPCGKTYFHFNFPMAEIHFQRHQGISLRLQGILYF